MPYPNLDKLHHIIIQIIIRIFTTKFAFCVAKERGDRLSASTSPLLSSPETGDEAPFDCGCSCSCSRLFSQLNEIIIKMIQENDRLRAILTTNELRARDFLSDLEYVKMRLEATEGYFKKLRTMVSS